MSLCCCIARNWLSRYRIWFLNVSRKTRLVCSQCTPISISFSCFGREHCKDLQVESLLFVKLACLQQQLNVATGTLRLRSHAVCHDRCRTLCARVTTETECERIRCKTLHRIHEMITQTQKDYSTLLVSMMSAPSPSRYIAYSELSVVSVDVKQHRVRSHSVSVVTRAHNSKCTMSIMTA